MTVRVGINGFGRIGRALLRCGLPKGLEIVAINDLADAPALAHLLKHDSTFGPYGLPVAASASAIEVDGRTIEVTGHRDPAGGTPTGWRRRPRASGRICRPRERGRRRVPRPVARPASSRRYLSAGSPAGASVSGRSCARSSPEPSSSRSRSRSMW